MATFHTGQIAPVTDTYSFAGHMANTACQPTPEERTIPLSAGKTFPPCKHCQSGAYWSN